MIEVKSLLEHLRDLQDCGPLPVGASQVAIKASKVYRHAEAARDAYLPGQASDKADAENGLEKGGETA